MAVPPSVAIERALRKLQLLCRGIQSEGYRRGILALPQGHDLTILDPWYSGPGSHHECYNEALVAAGAAKGLKSAVLLSGSLPFGSRKKPGKEIPFFSCKPYRYSATAPQFLDYVSKTTASLLASLNALPRHSAGAPPAYLMHTCVTHHLLGLSAWIQQLPRGEHRLSLFFQHAPEMMVAPEVADTARELFVTGLNQVLDAGDGRVTAHVAAGCLADHFVTLGAPRLPVAPPAIRFHKQPAELPARVTAALQRSKAVPVLGFVGSGRREKGLQILLEAIRILSQAKYPVRCVILLNESLADLQIPASAVSETIDLIERIHLTPSQVQTALAALDCVVLPYDPVRYRNRLSNILYEALGVGTPFIATGGGSTLQTDSQSLGAAAALWVPSHDAEALAAAIKEFVPQAGLLGKAAIEQAAAFRQAFSGDALLDLLLPRA